MFLAPMLLLLAPIGASDPTGASCTLRHDAVFFDRLDQMPSVIREDFLARVKSIAGRDEPFDGGDVGPHTLPTRRFLRGVHSRGSYFIWYERGGIGRWTEIVGYEIGRTGISRTPAARMTGLFSGDPCTVTDAVLDGIRPIDPKTGL